MEEFAGAITRSITRSSPSLDLAAKPAGIEELRVVLFARESGILLETSNLLDENSANGNTIALRELRAVGKALGAHASGTATLAAAQATGKQRYLHAPHCESHVICVPLRTTGSPAEPSFGGVIAKIQANGSGLDRAGVDSAIALGAALSRHHAAALQDFGTLVTSLLLNPVTLAPENPSPQPMVIDCTSAALAPLSGCFPLQGPLPRVSLLTLEFREAWLETEYREWKAATMSRIDAWSLLACAALAAALVPVGAAAAVLLAAVAVAVGAAAWWPAAQSLYRRHRDLVLVVATLGTYAAAAASAGSPALQCRLYALFSLLLPVRLTWYVPQAAVTIAWRAAALASSAPSPVAWARLIALGSLVPLAVMYVMEVVSRRAFLSRQAILAAETADDMWREEDSFDDDVDDEEHYFDD